MDRKSLAITLLIGTFLTLIWACISPRYRLTGQTQTYAEPEPTGNGSSNHEVIFWHADPTKFTGGLVVIWTSTFGTMLLPSAKRTP